MLYLEDYVERKIISAYLCCYFLCAFFAERSFGFVNVHCYCSAFGGRCSMILSCKNRWSVFDTSICDLK